MERPLGDDSHSEVLVLCMKGLLEESMNFLWNVKMMATEGGEQSLGLL